MECIQILSAFLSEVVDPAAGGLGMLLGLAHGGDNQYHGRDQERQHLVKGTWQ